MTSTSKIWKELTSILSNLNNFHSLEIVNRVSETQLQVGENSDWIIWRLKSDDVTVPTQWSVIRKNNVNVSEYCSTSPSAQSWQYRDRRKHEVGTMPYSYLMTARVLYQFIYSAQNHRHNCTLQFFEQFGALYVHNRDDKHLMIRPNIITTKHFNFVFSFEVAEHNWYYSYCMLALLPSYIQ